MTYTEERGTRLRFSVIHTTTQCTLFGIMRVIVVKVVMMLGPGRSG